MVVVKASLYVAAGVVVHYNNVASFCSFVLSQDYNIADSGRVHLSRRIFFSKLYNKAYSFSCSSISSRVRHFCTSSANFLVNCTDNFLVFFLS